MTSLLAEVLQGEPLTEPATLGADGHLDGQITVGKRGSWRFVLDDTLAIRRVLGTIPERERIALIRTMVDGDTAADVAKDLGVSTDRVYTLVHNGSTRVRRRAA